MRWHEAPVTVNAALPVSLRIGRTALPSPGAISRRLDSSSPPVEGKA